MAQSSVVVPPNSTGASIDTWTTTTAAFRRQGIVIADPDTDANTVAIPSTRKLPIQSEQQLDYDTGAGTATQSLVGLALPASGGPVAGGTSTNPLRTDPTGTTAQPITDNAGSITVDGTVTTSPPANASTNIAQLAGTATDVNSGVKSAGTLRVVIATDQPALTNKLLVTPDLPSGASTAAKQPALGTAGTASTDVITIQGIAAMTKLLVTPDSVALPANQSTNEAQYGGTNVVNGGTAGAPSVGGIQAHDAADSGNNPVKIGVKATNVEPSAVSASGDIINLIADLVGKLIVLPYANPENFVQGVTAAITDTTSTSVIASAGGSLRNYITQITVSNSSLTIGTFVKILDGATIIWEVWCAPSGGATASFNVPLKGTAATAINCQPVTTGASIIASCSGYKGL